MLAQGLWPVGQHWRGTKINFHFNGTWELLAHQVYRFVVQWVAVLEEDSQEFIKTLLCGPSETFWCWWRLNPARCWRGMETPLKHSQSWVLQGSCCLGSWSQSTSPACSAHSYHPAEEKAQHFPAEQRLLPAPRALGFLQALSRLFLRLTGRHSGKCWLLLWKVH